MIWLRSDMISRSDAVNLELISVNPLEHLDFLILLSTISKLQKISLSLSKIRQIPEQAINLDIEFNQYTYTQQ